MKCALASLFVLSDTRGTPFPPEPQNRSIRLIGVPQDLPGFLAPFNCPHLSTNFEARPNLLLEQVGNDLGSIC